MTPRDEAELDRLSEQLRLVDSQMESNPSAREAPAQAPKRIVGTLTGVDLSFLTIETSGGEIAVRREAIQAVEISKRRSWRKRGALIGAGLGVLAALVIAASEDYSPREICFLSCATVTPSSFASEVLIGASVLGLAGAGLGAAVAPGERWVAAKPLPQGSGSPLSLPSGLRLTVSMRF